MRLPWAVPAAAVLAACSPAPIERAEEGASAPAVEAASEPTDPAAPVGSLVGEYRVAGIDGEPIDAPFGLVLSVTESRIVFAAHCGGYAWGYRLEGLELASDRVQSPDPDCQTRAPIAGEVHAVAAAVDGATRAVRTPSNGIELSGGGHSVTLYSQ